MALGRMVKHGQRDSKRAMPKALLQRLPIWLQEQAVTGNRESEAHWLDTLVSAMEMHKAQYWAEAEALAAEACPPVELFENGRYVVAILSSGKAKANLDLVQQARTLAAKHSIRVEVVAGHSGHALNEWCERY